MLEMIQPTRNLNLLYIILDTVFILVFLALLIWKKRFVTLIWSLFGGVLYFVVDFGYFYLISHSRKVMIDGVEQGAFYVFWVLLWMSMSYGITNFAFIWLCLKKDRFLKEWLFLIVAWWLVCPSIASLGGEATIQTFRTTGKYHGVMAALLIVGYLFLVIRNMKSEKRIPILRLNLIGFFVQFGWEFALLLNGIRPLNEASFMTLIVNSCIETNMGMPYIYLIYQMVSRRWNDDLSLKLSIDDPILDKTEKRV